MLAKIKALVCFHKYVSNPLLVGNNAKWQSQNGCYKKTKHDKFLKKRIFLTPDTHMHVCISGGKKWSFFGKFGELCFLVISVFKIVLFPRTISLNWKACLNWKASSVYKFACIPPTFCYHEDDFNIPSLIS